MSLDNFIEKIKKKAEDFGFQFESEQRKPQNAVWRKNIQPQREVDFRKGAYFGLINADEESSGAYSDYSLAIFPNIEFTKFVIAFVVGSLGFKNDYEAASLPWLRRLFLKLRNKEYAGQQFFKVDFTDIETPSAIVEQMEGFEDLQEVIRRYQKVIVAAQQIDLEADEEAGLDVIYKWLATYATFREVARNQNQRNSIASHLPKNDSLVDNSPKNIYALLKDNRFVVLQGAPGTGKTWTANQISTLYFKEENGKTFFEQFHAETTYASFVHGIRPKTEGQALLYEDRDGILLKSINFARENPDKKTLLIIDEINRANLSNVLGPVFYLFEKNAGERNTKMQIGNIELDKLPDNFYVLATMNTADRSLAVVDFALRRRFSWVTLTPQVIEIAQDSNLQFFTEEFEYFENIFNRYASSEELNLQPGQSYFMAESKDVWLNRLKYELVPLMKEYFAEGYLRNAVSAFSDYVYDKLGLDLYE